MVFYQDYLMSGSVRRTSGSIVLNGCMRKLWWVLWGFVCEVQAGPTMLPEFEGKDAENMALLLPKRCHVKVDTLFVFKYAIWLSTSEWCIFVLYRIIWHIVTPLWGHWNADKNSWARSLYHILKNLALLTI